MHAANVLYRTRGLATVAVRRALAVSGRSARPASIFARLSSTEAVIPKSMQPRPEELATGTVKTILGDLDANAPPTNIKQELWTMYVATLHRLNPDSSWPPKRRVLHWLLNNADTREELDIALQLTEQWRMHMLPITQATTHIWAQACMRIKYPEPFVKMLLDRWKYRQLPVSYTLARFIKFLGEMAKHDEGSAEQLLDDAFRVFALYPYYGLSHDAYAYGALVEACCEVNSEEAWRRALVASEETLAYETPLITLEALQALEKRSTERNEPEMAQRYRDLAKQLELKPTGKNAAQFDEEGNMTSPGFD
ncbi:hypothetical protein IWW40_005488 [Coemansia sp. RSA 1250]|nr:hypothetical protein IWW40_005488 [Coemansia sp. RSA 1250]